MTDLDHRLRRTGKNRQALTHARQPSPIDTWGSPDAAARLGRALDVGDEAIDDYTHRFHSYPARLHPATARRVLAELRLDPGARLLDPFCGSGTVLVEGIRAGLATSGLDASPLAILVARAKTWSGSGTDRRVLVRRAADIRDEALAAGKAVRRAGQAPPEPKNVDRKRQQALSGWFDPHVRRELEALRAAVTGDEILRFGAGGATPHRGPLAGEMPSEILRSVLSSILIKVSRRAADSRAELAPRAVARGRAARLFADRAAELVGGLEALWRDAPRGTPPAEIRLGDARALPAPADAFDAILTSPPYAGTYDYAEQHALRLAFLGMAPVEKEIGSRSSFEGKSDLGKAIAGWERDLGAVLTELGRVVRGEGPIILVIGDSLAGTRAIYADQMLGRLAPPAGLEVIAGASAGRPLLGRVETHAFAESPKREHLIWLVRKRLDRPRAPRRSPSS